MKRFQITCFLILLSLVTIIKSSSLKKTFLKTTQAKCCTNIRLEGATLRASCTDANNNKADAQMDLNRCIGNIDGTLKREHNYSNSCRDCRVNGTVLTCNCQKADQWEWLISGLDLSTVLRITNGQLSC